jgi:hypothetical protein
MIREITCRWVAVFALILTNAKRWPLWTRHLGSCQARVYE